MRLMIVVPRQSEATGNQVTAARFRRHLEGLGHEVRVEETSGEPAALADAVRRFWPDAALLLHAYRSGRPWIEMDLHPAPPFAVMLTGTDISQSLYNPAQGPFVTEVLARAGAVLTQNPLWAQELPTVVPGLGERLAVIPQGVTLGSGFFALRSRLPLQAGDRVFLCPASLRPVKAVVELLALFDALACHTTAFHLAVCGPVLDEAYGQKFFEALACRPWASYLGVIPHEAMASALSQADVVLNNSSSEGLPNALVEACVLGRAILARNIPGNAAVVRPGIDGMLYEDEGQFTAAALELIRNPRTLEQLSTPRPERFDPSREAEALEAVLTRLIPENIHP